MDKLKVCHVFNRGVDKRVVFRDMNDYLRFIEGLIFFNDQEPVKSLWLKHQQEKNAIDRERAKLVEIYAFCLLPNHYHLLLRELTKNGLSEFMKRVGGGYTGYFNYNNDRSGSLFQGTYRKQEVKSENYALYLSAYINGNSEIHGIQDARSWPWCSYRDYIQGKILSGVIDQLVYDQIPDDNFDYLSYSKEVISRAKNLKDIKKLSFD